MTVFVINTLAIKAERKVLILQRKNCTRWKLQPGRFYKPLIPRKILKNYPGKNFTRFVMNLRQYIIDVVSVHGGHFGASLGVVELTVALHYVYNTPYDQLVWDVGHQAYGHKILTGRRDNFHHQQKIQRLKWFSQTKRKRI